MSVVHHCKMCQFYFQGEQSSIKGMKDLFLHTYVTDFRTCLVVENKVSTPVVHVVGQLFSNWIELNYALSSTKDDAFVIQMYP